MHHTRAWANATVPGVELLIGLADPRGREALLLQASDEGLDVRGLDRPDLPVSENRKHVVAH